jgi:hypothetical protein
MGTEWTEVSLFLVINCQFAKKFIRPASYQELFNLRHASLRNVIERIFGICKRRFRLMVAAPEYDIHTQSKIPYAMAALHNFIRIHDPDDNATTPNDHTEGSHSQVPQSLHEIDPENLGGNISQAERNGASERRDIIAKAMWEDYQNVLAEREMDITES